VEALGTVEGKGVTGNEMTVTELGLIKPKKDLCPLAGKPRMLNLPPSSLKPLQLILHHPLFPWWSPLQPLMGMIYVIIFKAQGK